MKVLSPQVKKLWPMLKFCKIKVKLQGHGTSVQKLWKGMKGLVLRIFSNT